jgi:dTDP-4-dehydrorhamnose reductase
LAFARERCRPRILLTGKTGQVGWELARSLWALGDVVATERTSNESAIPAIDLREPASIRSCIRYVKPDVIINAAAYTAVDKAESEPDVAVAINAHAPGILAEEAARLGAILVHFSTDYVFDGTGEQPWKEDDPAGPLNVYGRSKLAGEEAIRASEVPHLILRTSWVFGVRGANFVRTMLRLAAERTSLSIVNDQIGAPTSARLVADTTALILSQARGNYAPFLQEFGGTVHLASAGQTSWHEFATEIFRLATQRGQRLAISEVIPIPSSAYPTPATRPKNSRLDCSRLAHRFGLIPPSWQATLADCLDGLLAQKGPAP